MNYLMSFIMILLFGPIVYVCSQDLSRDPQKAWAKSHYGVLHQEKYRVDATISNDTLYITDESHLTTIKIGNKFYKIVKHEPTIELMPTIEQAMLQPTIRLWDSQIK